MSRIFYTLVLIVGIISAKPLNFVEVANKLSEVTINHYITPILDKTLISVRSYEECEAFNKVINHYKQVIQGGNICVLQSNFKEFIYIHEVLDRFFRAIVDRENYHAIDVVVYFIGLFNELFKFGNMIEIIEGMEVKHINDYTDEVLINKYYEAHNANYNKLYQWFQENVKGKEIKDINISNLEDFRVKIPLDVKIDLMTFIKYNSKGKEGLVTLLDHYIHHDLISNEEKAKILNIVSEDEKLLKDVCYHYAEISALSDFLFTYIRNMDADNVSINLFWKLINSINGIYRTSQGFQVGHRVFIDGLLSKSFSIDELFMYTVRNAVQAEERNLIKLGIVDPPLSNNSVQENTEEN